MTGFLSNITWKSGLLLVILVISEIIAETFLKKASKKKTGILMNWSKSLGLGVLSYIIVAVLFYLFLKEYSGSFSLANIIWQVANILIVTLISKFIFGDKVNWIQWVGFIFLIIGFILSGLEGETSYHKSKYKNS